MEYLQASLQSSCVAQRAVYFCLSGFSSGSCAACEGIWRNAQSCE
ncbi:hypothetical protein A2U01_0103593, partial [Trifolium medium]|nr:hypothetical protein [Trifolium medium]